MISKFKMTALVLLMILLNAGTGFSDESDKPLYPGFTPIIQSNAFQKFLSRPVNDESKILYLIDRFADSNIEIVYDGHYFSAALATSVAKWFFSRRYHKETPKQWVMKWCNSTVPSGNLIWVKLPNGKFKLSREILLAEVKSLDEAYAKRAASSKKNEIVGNLENSIPAEIKSASNPQIAVQAAAK